MIRFTVLGTPAPKGSNRAMVRGGRPVFVPGGSAKNQRQLLGWDANVRLAASHAVSGHVVPPYVNQPLAVAITFRVRRPAGHWGTGRNVGSLKPGAPTWPMVAPDIDKITRATLDSLTGIVFDDDARIALLTVRKEYASAGNEGATISVDVAP